MREMQRKYIAPDAARPDRIKGDIVCLKTKRCCG